MISKKMILTNRLIIPQANQDKIIDMYGDIIVYIIPYLYKRKDFEGIISFSIEKMILSANMTCTTGKGKSFEKFKNVLLKLLKNNIITYISEEELKKAKPRDLLEIKFNNPMDIINDKPTNYFLLDLDIFNSICIDEELDTIISLKIYFYISARLNRKLGNIKCCFPSINLFIKDLNISKRTLMKYLELLKEKRYINYGNVGNITSTDGLTKAANNVYVLDYDTLDDALKQSKYSYKSAGLNVNTSNGKSYDKSLSGIKGKIIQMDHDGRDSSELRNKHEIVQENMEGAYDDMSNYGKVIKFK